MRHRAKGRQLSRTSSHKKATLNNMATSLFLHGGIKTTVAKAKELRPFAERLITLARRPPRAAPRRAAPQGQGCHAQAVRRDRQTLRGPAGRLYANREAGAPRRRWCRHGPDRITE